MSGIFWSEPPPTEPPTDFGTIYYIVLFIYRMDSY